MPKAKEIAITLLVKNAYLGVNKLTTREVTDFINRNFHFQRPTTWREINRTSQMLRHMNHNGDVAKEKAEKGNLNLWWLTDSGKDYAKWWYKKMKEEGEI